MEASCVVNEDKSTVDDKELERLAVESLLDDVRRRKSRVDKVGTMGWVKERNVNKRFLNSLVLQTLPRHTARQCTQDREREHRWEEQTSERSGRHRTREYRHKDTLRTKDDRRREQSTEHSSSLYYHDRERSRSRETGERTEKTSMADSGHTRDKKRHSDRDATRSKHRQQPSRNDRRHRHFEKNSDNMRAASDV